MRLAAIALTLILNACAHEAQGPSSSFAEAYQKWKVEHDMSTFQPKQDADVLAAVAAGECGYANGAIFQYRPGESAGG